MSLTSWAKVSYTNTLMIGGFLPLLIAVGYFLVLKPPRTEIPVTERPIEEQFSEEVSLGQEYVPPPKDTLSIRERLSILFPLLQYMIPLFFVYYAEYLINQGVLPVLLFDGPFEEVLFKKEYNFF